MRRIIAVKDGRKIIYRKVGQEWLMEINWNGMKTFKIKNVRNAIKSLLDNGYKLHVE